MATSELQGPKPEGGPIGRVLGALPRGWRRFWRLVSFYMPKRLYARSLIIVIAPMILLQLSLIHI